jgi:uncharacterized protein (TIGR00251 family)
MLSRLRPSLSGRDDREARAEFYSIGERGVTLTVRVTPKASRSAFGGLVVLPDRRQALSVRAAAPPVEGAANAALVAFLAKELAVSRSDLAIISGETSRLKVIQVRGDGQKIARRLRHIVGGL